VQCKKSEEDENQADDEQEEEEIYETRYPYPKTPVEMNWSYEMSTQPYDESKKVYTEVRCQSLDFNCINSETIVRRECSRILDRVLGK